MDVIIEGTPHIPIADAAIELHTTHLRILMLIKQKLMAGCQVDGEWYVEKRALACVQSNDADGCEWKNCPSSCRGCTEK